MRFKYFHLLVHLITFFSVLLLMACSSQDMRTDNTEQAIPEKIDFQPFSGLFVENKTGHIKTPVLEKTEEITYERIVIDSDKDQDGITDLEDILMGARKDIENQPLYKSVYYDGGYPPKNEGVCTDVIWRALDHAGYALKEMVDEDIFNHTGLYPRVGGYPDPNIDFRRVQNLFVFFSRHADILTLDIIPGNVDNLEQWQGGDIVVFGKPKEHIAIVSDRRNEQGIPYIIHNSGPYTKEEDILIEWIENNSEIIGHFRFPKEESLE